MNIKRIVALCLTLVLIISVMCACGNNTVDNNETTQTTSPSTNDATTQPSTEPTEEPTMPPIPVKTDEELREEGRLRKQTIRGAQILIYDPKSDVNITLESDYFKDTCDVIRIKTGTLENKDVPFLTKIKQAGIVYIGSIDENFKFGDIINVDFNESDPKKFKCGVHGREIDMNIDAECASSASISLFDRYVALEKVKGTFFYDVMEFDHGNSTHITINGFMERSGNIEITRDRNVWTITSTTEMQHITVMTRGMGGEERSQTMDSTKPSCVYKIMVHEDGSVSIYTK